MIMYLCMKYESNTPMFSKDIARKPFFVRKGQDVRDIRMYVRTDKGDAICPPPPHYKWPGHNYPAMPVDTQPFKHKCNDIIITSANNTFLHPW